MPTIKWKREDKKAITNGKIRKLFFKLKIKFLENFTHGSDQNPEKDVAGLLNIEAGP